MQRRRLGRTGITVPEICLGTMTFGLQTDEAESLRIMDRAHAAGIDFFDTAEIYPVPPDANLVGVTETIVGRWLNDKPRDSLINRRCESELAQVCRQESVSLLAYSPVGGGVLTGKYQEGATPAGARFSDYLTTGGERQKRMAQRFVNPRTLETTARLQPIAQDLGIDLATLAVAWSKQHDFVASTIVGASSAPQLDPILAAADLVLDDETLARIDQIDVDIPNPMTEDGLRRL